MPRALDGAGELGLNRAIGRENPDSGNDYGVLAAGSGNATATHNADPPQICIDLDAYYHKD